ncbi:hypothetical protein B6N60_04647 [Richelia sinica FACHB-800]|uniref:Transposase n=1 Tax=Richelia sinica FACHB-800 TaxID=1357546 RepID=A0A975TCH5_9NOST|nr:hypothetical protein B6N60_04647 [Richelia sinica FACHB-800]
MDANELSKNLVSTVRKLTDSDKKEILKLYRETAETTSTLAERYDVSNSTISRLLKSTLAEEEYEYLVSLKRAARTPEGRAQVSYEQIPLLTQPEPETEQFSPSVEVKLPEVQPAKLKLEAVAEAPTVPRPVPVIRRVKTRSSANEQPPAPASAPEVNEELEIIRHKPPQISPISPPISRPLLDDDRPEVTALAEMLGEELDDSDDLDDLDDDFYEDDEDFDDEDYGEPTPLVSRRRPGEAPVQVLPLSVAHLPKTCYLVIDRSAELITRPLKDFGDLGTIPIIETQQRTLPVFDNHRVAKRFSTKRDRVIKVPDSRMLHKARTHLQAKGITRLLIDGQVYSLSMV